jgi:O-antigen/teichoic acid export membrane protein
MEISKAKTFRNVVYTALTKGLTVLCWGLTSLVVARNLTPSDYGVVRFVSIIILFTGRFSDMGLAGAVIRRPEIRPESLKTVLTLKIILSLSAFAVTLLIAPFARLVFSHPATGNLIRIAGLSFLVSTVGFIPQILLMRQMNYRALIIPGIVSASVQCLVTVTLVLLGWSYWAVIIANVAAPLAGGIATQFMKRIFVGFGLHWNDAKEYLRFGVPLIGSSLLYFLVYNLDNFLVGTSLGSAQLGYYALAFTWGSFICLFLQDTVCNVLLPTLAGIQDNTAAMRRWFLKTVDLVALVAVAVNSVLFVNAHYFLVTLLGKGSSKWVPAETALKILCIYGMARAVIEVAGPLLMARGETKTLFRASSLVGVVEVVLLLRALRSGRIEMVAVAVLVAYGFSAAVFLSFLRRELSIGIPEIVAKIWPVVPALVMGYMATSLLPAWLGTSVTGLAIRGLFTALVVLLSHGLFTRFRCFHEAKGMILPNLARIRTLRLPGVAPTAFEGSGK